MIEPKYLYSYARLIIQHNRLPLVSKDNLLRWRYNALKVWQLEISSLTSFAISLEHFFASQISGYRLDEF